ncbi:RNA pol II accessory factor, CDC73 family protein [Cryptosporidium serpentis]
MSNEQGTLRGETVNLSEDETVSVLVDPLIIFKDCILRNTLDKITKSNNKFIFKDYNCIIDCNVPTRCRSRRGEIFSLMDLYLFVTASRNKEYTFRFAQEHDCRFISVLEKKNILDFLEEKLNYEEGIPLKYTMADVSKYECIAVDFPLQPCYLLDPNIRKIELLSEPWVEYNKMSDISNLIEVNETSGSLQQNNSILLKDQALILPIKYFHSIHQLYPIGVDYVCPGMDINNRLSQLVMFMSEPPKQDTNSGGTLPSKKVNKDRQNIPNNIPKSISSRYNRSSLLTYLRSNNLNPIILTPLSSRSPITINNVVSFLKDKTFIDPSTAERLKGSYEQTVTLKFGSGVLSQDVVFRIVESTLNFRKRDWYSLVAIFVTGAEWQLEAFPFKSIPDIFSTIKGYHITYESDSIPENIRKWNVEVVRINRTSRHNDVSVWLQLMASIESFLASSRDHSKYDRNKMITNS